MLPSSEGIARIGRTAIVYGASKIGVVEDVEQIRSRLKRKPLLKFELPPQRQIDLRGAESAQGISSQIPLQARTRLALVVQTAPRQFG
jgi:hypothetical protein